MRSIPSTTGKFTSATVGFLLLASFIAKAQETTPKSSNDKTVAAPQSMSETKKHEKRISLSDVSTVSNEEAARSAAHDAATKASKDKLKSKSSDGSSVDSVLEFKPAPQDSRSARTTEPGVKTTLARKNIHGQAYGSLDPAHSGYHQSGGSVGAGSKSGKAHVYVETDQSRSTKLAPH